MPNTPSKAVSVSDESDAPTRQYVAYYRVSTDKQGRSGLGLEAQRAAVARFLAKTPGKLVAEFTEVKSGSKANRPQLDEALRTCRVHRATLVIARLDRLSRNVSLIAKLMQSGLEFVAADFPQANRLTIHILAAVAEYETKAMSDRVKAGIAAAKARGVKFLGSKGSHHPETIRVAVAARILSRRRRTEGRARDLAPIVWELIAKGKSNTEIAEELTRQRIRTPRNGKWSRYGIERVRKLTKDEFASAPDVARAVRLGPRGFRMLERAQQIAPIIWEMRRLGKSTLYIADELNRRGVPTAKKRPWNASTVWKVLTLTADKPVAIGHPFPLVRSGLRVARAKERAALVAPTIWELRSKGQSHHAIACELDRQGIPAPEARGWSASTVANFMRYTQQEFSSIAEAFRPIRPRTFMALSNAKARQVAPLVWDLAIKGKSPAEVAEELNQRHVVTVGNRGWHASTVRTVMRRTKREFAETHDLTGLLNLGPRQFRTRARAMRLAPIVSELQASGLSLTSIATELNCRGIPSPNMRNWYASSVSMLMRYISAGFGPLALKASNIGR